MLPHPKNKDGVYSAAMDAILAELVSACHKAKALQARDCWDLPKTSVVPYCKKVKDLQKCINTLVYSTYSDNEFEKDFAIALDTHSSVRWWMKNSRKGAEHFSIAVGAASLFYPNRLVQHTDGSVGCSTPRLTARAVVLQRYTRRRKAMGCRPIWAISAGKAFKSRVAWLLETRQNAGKCSQASSTSGRKR